MRRSVKSDLVAHFKRRFSSVKTKSKVTEMQSYVRSYETSVVPRINKLVRMFELWCNEHFFVMQGYTRKILEEELLKTESLIDPKYDTFLQTFSQGREENSKLRNKAYRIKEEINTLSKVSVSSEDLKRQNQSILKDPSITNFPSLGTSSKDFYNVGEFSFGFFNRYLFYERLGDNFEICDIKISDQVETLNNNFFIEKERFYELDYFKDIISELKHWHVCIDGVFGRTWSLTYEKDSAIRRAPELALKILDETLTKIQKQERSQNLKSMAARNTDEQRNVAKAARAKHTYNEQIRHYGHCPYCNGVLGGFDGHGCCELDHIHPVSKGGLSTVQNLVFICSDCNQKKRAQTLNQFIISEGLNRDGIFKVLAVLGKDF